MGDAGIFKNYVCGTPHDDKVFLPREFLNVLTLVKEDGVRGGQTVEAVKVCGEETHAVCLANHVEALNDVLIRACLALCLQALQHVLKDGRIVVVDVQIVRELETDLCTAAAVGAADTNHKVVILREGLCAGHEGV